MISYGDLLDQCAKTSINNARLDAEILLAHVLQRPRSYVISHLDETTRNTTLQKFQQLWNQRLAGWPVAYLLQNKEFWSRTLTVTADVLIPRPDTETLVEQGLALIRSHSLTNIVELGSGSGGIAIALALEVPNITLHATDISSKALTIAQQNANRLGAKNIQWYKGSWFEPLKNQTFDLIISNPPYLSEHEWLASSPELKHEPKNALVAGPQGHEALKHLIENASRYLTAAGWLALEHAPHQASAIRELLVQNRFTQIQTHLDLAQLERVSVAQRINRNAT